MSGSSETLPTVAHIVFRFDYGGLENGVVNILNGIERAGRRHVVIALTEATSFAGRLPDGVDVHGIGKRPGKDLGSYVRLYRLLKKLRPQVVHTRNFGTIDCAFIAFLARVPIRLHSEHGWDVFDPDGTRRKYRWMRRLMSVFVHRFVTVSADLETWLVNVVRISKDKVELLRNGVDTRRFSPPDRPMRELLPDEFRREGVVVIGSVTRFSAIKDPLNLVGAFIKLAGSGVPGDAALVMIGSGELYETARDALADAGFGDSSWLPGARDDVAELMKAMDIFVLGSLREGISNTVLEAMASGLPIVASDAGGNRELVVDGVNGLLVPPGDSAALAEAISGYVADPLLRRRHGEESRRRACTEFSLDVMIERYHRLYERALEEAAA